MKTWLVLPTVTLGPVVGPAAERPVDPAAFPPDENATWRVDLPREWLADGNPFGFGPSAGLKPAADAPNL
jgi:hypothetical protein